MTAEVFGLWPLVGVGVIVVVDVVAGVRPIGPHQIRHLLASSLLDGGYGIHEVAERLGHDPGTLMPYHSRVNAQRRRQATDHIAELMS